MIVCIALVLMFTPHSKQSFISEFQERTYIQIMGIVNFALRWDKQLPLHMDVSFNLYTRENTKRRKVLYVNSNLAINNSDFNISTPTIFVIHGYTDHENRFDIIELRKSILDAIDANVIVVDWRRLAGQIYFNAAANTYLVGRHLGSFIEFLEEIGVNLKDVYIIGHSLGAQVAGVAGNYLNGRIGRITGLDPAGPLFETIKSRNESEMLDKTDAKFVDVIHTASSSFGIFSPVGHVDFYPNDGTTPQPGCTNIITAIMCSHGRSVRYYIESLTGSAQFLAKPCMKWHGHELVDCKAQTFVEMGYHTPRNARGNFYLQTKDTPPYAMGPKFYKRKSLQLL